MIKRKGDFKIMSMSEWAIEEIRIAKERERKNNSNKEVKDVEQCITFADGCYDKALKAYLELLDDNHIGARYNISRRILERLMSGKPLTPIIDSADVWTEITRNEEEVTYQCKRLRSLFKTVNKDGSTAFKDINICYSVDASNPEITFNSDLITSLINKLNPVIFPYAPSAKRIEVYCERFSTNLIDDVDTIGVLKAIYPDGTRVDINMFFKDVDGETTNIDFAEYSERKLRKTQQEGVK